MNKQLINVVSQRPCKCVQTSELNLFHEHTMYAMYATINFLGKHVIQTTPSKFAKGYSETFICANSVCSKGENYRGVPEGRSNERDASFKQVKPWQRLSQRQTDREGGRGGEQTDRQTGGGGGGGGQTDRQTETCSTGTTIDLSSEDQNQKNASLDWQVTHKADTGRGW